MNEQSLYKFYLDTVHAYFRRFIDMSREEFDLIAPYFEIRKFDKKTKVLEIQDIKYEISKGCHHAMIIYEISERVELAEKE